MGRATRSLAPLLIYGQAITELYPCNIVAEPRMMSRREHTWLVEAARGDVDGCRAILVLVRQRGTARGAKGAPHQRRRGVPRRCAFDDGETRFGKRDPSHNGSCRNTSARLAMADHAIGRLPLNLIPNSAARAATVNHRCHYWASKCVVQPSK